MLLLCALVAGSSSVWADTATITFASQTSGTNDGNTAYTTSTFVSNGIASSDAAFGTITCSATSKCYSGKTGYGLKAGAASSAGSFTIAFSTPLANVTKITLNRASYNTSNTATITVKNGSTTLANAVRTPSGNTNFVDMDITGLSITSLGGLTVNTSKYCYIKSITITYSSTPTCAAPDFSPVAGTVLSGTTVALSTTTEDATIYYTIGAEPADPTTSSATYSTPIEITENTTIKAIAVKAGSNNSDVASATYTVATPITVSSALTAIQALENNGTIDNQCVRGVVSTEGTLNNGKINYYISTDGSTDNQLYIYNGKGLYNTDFTAATDIQVGDEVVVFGQLKKYVSGNKTTPEFNGGYLLSISDHKQNPTFSLDITEKTLDAYSHETVDVTLTTNTDGAITCESSNEDVATVALKSGNVYTITAQTTGTATITIKSALGDTYKPASATVDITVTDTREEAGISFAEDAEEITWGDAYTGQALTNTNSLPVTWSSTDETVATVNASGVVSVLKAGSTDIKATFAGDATYKSAVASYTLTINKAAAGLSYAQTEFEIMLGDDSFVAPTLNNPNSLTVTYSSNNEKLAVVDENTGELVYDENIAGTATITAYFAGNDNYEAGNAKYTLNIVDPTAKGSKYNPYTVAEVIDGTATGSGIYVIGFIVGEYVGNTTAPRTSSFSGNSNMAIADPFTSTPTASGSIPIQLGTTALQNAWGCKKTNGALLGYEVLIKGNVDNYFSVKGIKSTSEITAISIPYNMNQYEWSTLVSDKALDFENSGVTAYVVTGHNGNVLEKTEVTTVAANTPLLLNATAGNYNIPVAASGTAYTDNKLVAGTGAAVAKEDGKTRYVLSLDDNGNIAFLKINNDPAIVPADKAYLEFNEVVAAPSFDFGDATAIDDVRSKTEDVRGDYYNLNGQRVANPTKGLYIVNGKKVIVK